MKKITLDEWLNIATEVLEEISARFSDDGKISIADAFGLVLCLLKAIAKAYKED